MIVSISRRNQRGMSAFGWIIIAGIFGLLLISFFKIFPMYYGNFKLQSALEALAADPEIDPKSKRAIWESLQKRLFINEIRHIKRENVQMSRKDGRTTVVVEYEMRDAWIGNLFLGAHFSESIVIDR